VPQIVSRVVRHGGSLLEEWGEPQISPLAALIGERKSRGLPVFDFIGANPQEHGFEFPPQHLSIIFDAALKQARYYRPDPRGQLSAREAVAHYHGGAVSADQVLLTPGTSMAYWYCFRLLAVANGNILCPRPTYPLFDDLARLAGMEVRSYHLEPGPAGHWILDPEELEFQITKHTRAIVIVSPHNPTGSVANAQELEAVCRIARRHRLAIIFDEVFRETLHTVSRVPRPSEFGPPLAITLNGLSKMLSLPGLKAGWCVIEGEDKDLVRRFLAALEYASDTFLPVNEVVQFALSRLLAPDFFAVVRDFAELYRTRMRRLLEEWRSHGNELICPEAGIYLTVDLPEFWQDDEDCVLRLLNEHGIYCHPGSFYKMPRPAIVTTCVPSPPWPVREMASVLFSR
jgi:aspartate/methionine/tyrosine aminotransferase